MITPQFECEQDDTFVIVRIKVPHVKMSSMEYTIADNVFHFYVKPYFLRLTFERQLAENGTDSCKYDVDNGVVIVNLPKRNHGEYFPDLNMMTKLLSGGSSEIPKRSKNDKPLIEVIRDEQIQEEPKKDFEFEWEQTIPRPFSETDSSLLEFEDKSAVQINIAKPTYGFNGNYSQFFTSFSPDYIAEIIDLRNPDTTPKSERSLIHEQRENEDFDPDYYIADFIMNQEIKKLIDYKARYQKELKKKRKDPGRSIKWNEVEKQTLVNLPKRECMCTVVHNN